MRVIYSKVPEMAEEQKIKEISFKCGILYDTARLLFCRNIDTPEKVKEFLYPSKEQFLSPFKFKEMPLLTERIAKAKQNGENVLVFGDYDADGICATCVLYYCLKEFGITAQTFIPEREEGYGLNFDIIKSLHEKKKIDLIITVDCGISDCEVIENIKGLGIDVVVTDHHEPPEILPNVIKINPKIADSGYPFNCLCGAGVAYKLGYALIGEKANEYLDFVAVATIADSMDLIGENRSLVAEGLKLFGYNKTRKQFASLIGDNNGKPITSQTITYGLAPKINAGGRMGDARSVLELLLATDDEKIDAFKEKLIEYNLNRQGLVDEIYRQAKQKIIDEHLDSDSIILVADDSWKTGCIGIVASKLVEEFSRPIIVFAGHDEDYKGSARSVEGVNIFDLISEVKDMLVAYGGHSQAAGVTVSKTQFNAFRTKLNEVFESKGSIDTERKIYAEWNIETPISIRFAREIEMLEPFGAGNRRPMFTIEEKSVQSNPLRLGSPHYTFKTKYLEMIDFNGESRVKSLASPIKKKIVFELNLSTFKGCESVKGVIKTVIPCVENINEIKLFVIANELKKIASGSEEIRVLPAMPKDFSHCNEEVAYLISDIDNLRHYPQFKYADLHVFDMGVTGVVNVIISPDSVPEKASKLVYLDVPLKYIHTDKKCVCKFDYSGFKYIDNLSVERSVFAENFGKIVANAGREFKNVVDFYNTYVKTVEDTEEQAIQFIFCFEVFKELGFFYEVGGVLRRDSRVQQPLTNSLIYTRISDLKE